MRRCLAGPSESPPRRLVGLALVLLLALGGCAQQAPAVVIGYSSTPSPVIIPATATPKSARQRRPTRIPSTLTSPTLSRPATPELASPVPAPASGAAPPRPTDLTAPPTAAPGTASTESDPNATDDLTPPVAPVADAPNTPADPATPTAAPPVATSIDLNPSAIANPTPSAVPATDTPTPGASVAIATASPTSAGSPASGFPGQVSADQGQFVTTSSKTSKYYYARDDKGWHRIHADHQVWFLTADALLRAFPGRQLHAGPTPTA